MNQSSTLHSKIAASFIFILILVILFGCNSTHEHPEPLPEISVDSELLEHSRKLSEWNRLLMKADTLLESAPLTVIDKPNKLRISDPQNYISMACYWWPDPDSKQGTPYIRIDGKVNPETRSSRSDLPKMIEMAQRIELLTTAYRLTGDETYSRKALEQLHVWFINQDTAMLPHLRHAQMIKGRNAGRASGLIDTWWLVRVIDSIPYLKNSEHWSDEMEHGLYVWFTHYLNWLRNSEFGQIEKTKNNNHGTWYDVQVITFAKFVGQKDFAKTYLSKVAQKRILRQINMFGRQKHELRRPRPLHYSIFNLNGIMRLAVHAREWNVSFKNSQSLLSGNIEDALNYLMKRMQNIDPSNLVDEYDRTDTDVLYLNILVDAWKLYQHPEIKNELKKGYQLITEKKSFPDPDMEVYSLNINTIQNDM